ncbi:MAG TPA: hypothetical protein VMH27_00020 [Puia sp.]|nr:hypothetical protein [Puia sp.]
MTNIEFDELKEIWAAQENRPHYVIDQNALQARIQSKMTGVLRHTDISEWLLIFVNLVAGCILLTLNPFQSGANIFMYVETTWMFATVAYIVISRIERIKASRRFDRSIHGDLNYAISVANYRVRLSAIILWNSLPMGAIMVLSGWEAGKFLSVGSVILISYFFAIYAGRKGLGQSKRRKRELLVLREKLEADS